MLKKWICGMLAVLMVLSLAGCGEKPAAAAVETVPAVTEVTQTVETEPAPEPVDEELEKALELGFGEPAMLEEPDAPVSYQDYVAMLSRLVELVDPSQQPLWKLRTDGAFPDPEESINRIEGAILLFLAADRLNLETIGPDTRLDLENKVPEGMDFRQGISSQNIRVKDSRSTYSAKEMGNNMWREIDGIWRQDAAVLFVQQLSLVSGKPYLDYDGNYMLNFDQPFTCEAAMRSVLRLYETAAFGMYVPVEQVQCGISQEALAAGAALPEVTEEKLPDWHGFSIAMPIWGQAYYVYGGMLYQQEQIEVLAQQGFNFVRVPLDARDFFPGEDYTRVNPAQLENLDRLIDMCAHNGIHVCIDLHDMVGFYTDRTHAGIPEDLFTNPQRQEQFVSFWQFFAQHYKEVSPNLLSFNLLNEPHANMEDGKLSDLDYAAVMIPAIEAIRQVREDRVIVADMVDQILGIPSQALVQSGVVQSWHPYLVIGGEGFDTWPLNLIPGFTHKNNGIFTMVGSFPAGTKVTVDINAFHGTGSLVLKAGETTVGSQEFGTEAVGENGCIQIQEEGTGGEFRSYAGRILEFTLPEAAEKLTIRQQGNAWWYNATKITVDTGANVYAFKSSGSMFGEDKVPNVTLHDNGTVHDNGSGTVMILDRESLMELFSQLARFREDTGIQIMAQEFGFPYRVPQAAAEGAVEGLLYAFDALDIPWCSWCGDFGPMIDAREAEMRLTNWEQIDMRRPGSTWTPVSENWIVNEGLMDVFKTYMN